jgi:hypothetical protein
VVVIDTLPNDVSQLKSMLKQVKGHIKDLEIQFLEEENSDKEEQLKSISMSVEKHDERL